MEAFAKFLGGYQELPEKSTAWALSVMTGDPTRPGTSFSDGAGAVRIFVRKDDGMWARKELEAAVEKHLL